MDSIGRFLIGVLLTGVAEAETWKLVPHNVTAFLHSCVVIPCKCTFPGNVKPHDEAKIWFKGHDNWNSVVAHSTSPGKIHSNFTRRALIPDKALNNCTLLIQNVTRGDAGKYIFRLEINHDGQGKFTYRSSPFYISVSDVPSEPVLESPARIVEGEDTSLKCQATSSCPQNPPNLSWAGLNQIISIKLSGQYSSTLTFKPSCKDHGKIVQCLVQYQHLKIVTTGNITLAVEYSPRNTQVVFQKDGNATETGKVPLTCVSDANPEPHNYSWIRQVGESEVSLGRHSRTITVSRDSGNYRCVAINTVGSDKSPPRTGPGIIKYLAIGVTVLIFGFCVIPTLVLVFRIRSRRHQQFGTLESPDSTMTVPQLTRSQQKSRNVYACHSEDFYANVRDVFTIYANCSEEVADPRKEWARYSGRLEDVYANVNNQTKHRSFDQLDVY